jgi:hypothetical protein
MHGISSRTLGRWIEKYENLVIRKVSTNAVRGTKENPFQIGDIVEVSKSIYLDYGYDKASEYYDEVEEGRGVIVNTDYDYNEYYFPDIDVEIDGASHLVEICHIRYIEDIEDDTQDSLTEIVTNYSIANDTVLEIKQDEPIHFTGTSQSITLYRGEESVTVHKDQKTYPKVVQVLLDGELEEAWTIGNVKETLEKFSEGSLVVNNGVVTINGFEVVNDMSNRLIDMLDDGTSQCAEGIKVFARFFENLMNVQDKRIVDELYLFLRHNDIKLNADGSFTGYKAVNRDYKDHRTNRIDNSPGNVVTMPRSLVNDDKYQACSTGLHVGSYDYVKDFGGQWARFVAVKVFPEDVVSVPIDYNGGKLRACKYEVIEDVTDRFID